MRWSTSSPLCPRPPVRSGPVRIIETLNLDPVPVGVPQERVVDPVLGIPSRGRLEGHPTGHQMLVPPVDLRHHQGEDHASLRGVGRRQRLRVPFADSHVGMAGNPVDAAAPLVEDQRQSELSLVELCRGGQIGGVEELMEDGKTGLLVPPRSPSALSDAICSILGDNTTAKQMGNAGYQRAVKFYNADRNVRQITDIYDRLLNGRK